MLCVCAALQRCGCGAYHTGIKERPSERFRSLGTRCQPSNTPFACCSPAAPPAHTHAPRSNTHYKAYVDNLNKALGEAGAPPGAKGADLTSECLKSRCAPRPWLCG